jgi:hypothetical protein
VLLVLRADLFSSANSINGFASGYNEKYKTALIQVI